MKIRFLKLVDKYKPGEVAEIGDSQANKLIWRRLAEKAPETPDTETPKAEAAPVETAEIRPTDEAAVTRASKPQPRWKGK